MTRDLRTPGPALRGAVAAGVLALAVGCGAPPGTPTAPPAATPPAATPPAATAPQTTSGSPVPQPGVGAHNDADVRFAQGIIPHLEQAAEMGQILASKPGLSTELREVAAGIEARQAAEANQLRGWLKAWGSTEAGEQDAGGADGVLTAQQVKNLHDADTLTAARLYLTGMVAHHEAVIALARDDIAHGENPGARELAQGIVASRQAEIEGLGELLAGF